MLRKLARHIIFQTGSAIAIVSMMLLPIAPAVAQMTPVEESGSSNEMLIDQAVRGRVVSLDPRNDRVRVQPADGNAHWASLSEYNQRLLGLSPGDEVILTMSGNEVVGVTNNRMTVGQSPYRPVVAQVVEQTETQVIERSSTQEVTPAPAAVASPEPAPTQAAPVQQPAPAAASTPVRGLW